MYDTKATAGTAEREQLLRIQRELEEKYANESRPQYAGERLHEQPAAFEHSVPAEYREHDDKCEHCRRDTDCPAKSARSVLSIIFLSFISICPLNFNKPGWIKSVHQVFILKYISHLVTGNSLFFKYLPFS